jgi:2-haloacid dehalogenase
MGPTAVIFDIGGVLLDVDQRYLYRHFTDDDAAIEHFLGTVCTADWNYQQDRGRPEDEATEELVRRHPSHEDWIRAFYGQHLRTIGGEVRGSIACLQDLKSAGVPVFALSNWGDQSFARVEQAFEFPELFDDIIVSARVGLCKPEPAIYEMAMTRFALEPGDILFVDDRLENLGPAAGFGWTVHHFRGHGELRAELQSAALLPRMD